jgi:hypothetical protein
LDSRLGEAEVMHERKECLLEFVAGDRQADEMAFDRCLQGLGFARDGDESFDVEHPLDVRLVERALRCANGLRAGEIDECLDRGRDS